VILLRVNEDDGMYVVWHDDERVRHSVGPLSNPLQAKCGKLAQSIELNLTRVEPAKKMLHVSTADRNEVGARC
jgi:hypothetical protein